MVWQKSDAAERLEETRGAAGREGPRIVARRGVEVAVFVSAPQGKDSRTKLQKSTSAAHSQEKH